MNAIAFVFARGGSVGVPRKNIRALNGVPLLAYSIELAKKFQQVSDVYVSTDDLEIADVGLQYGAKIINRPGELATNDAPEWLSWQHAIDYLRCQRVEFDTFLSLPATAPLRSYQDVESCLLMLDSDVDMVLTMTESKRSPWFNMVREDNSYLSLLNQGDSIKRRQDAPRSYDLTTVAYVSHPEYIMNSTGIFEGRVKGVVVPEERSIDIDSEFDFLLAELLIRELKNE